MIDTSRIEILLPAPVQAAHYVTDDDLAIIQRWVAYLHAHGRVPDTVHTTVLDPDDAASDAGRRLVVNVRDKNGDRGEVLRKGRSLVLHRGQLTVINTAVLREGCLGIGVLFPGCLGAPAPDAQSVRTDVPKVLT